MNRGTGYDLTNVRYSQEPISLMFDPSLNLLENEMEESPGSRHRTPSPSTAPVPESPAGQNQPIVRQDTGREAQGIANDNFNEVNLD